MARESIKIVHGALDEVEGKEVILRGAVAPESMIRLKVDTYQREILPLTNINSLAKAFEAGESIPDIILGMRGGNFTEREGVFYLHDDVFIVDGLQRTQAAIKFLNEKGGHPRLGATIHFSTGFDWERKQFQTLNGGLRVKLSPNVLLRNERHDHAVVEMIHALTTTDKSCVMSDRVCWKQRMDRQHLISASVLLKTVALLHSHITTGGKGTRLDDLIAALERVVEHTSAATLAHNIKAFFAFVDESWGIRNVQFKEGAAYVRLTFLLTLASLFSRHEDFWKGDKLFVDKDLGRKIKAFPLTDPNVRNLTAASGKARYMLYQLLLDHVNSGKRTRRLTLRPEFRLAAEGDQAQVAALVATGSTDDINEDSEA